MKALIVYWTHTGNTGKVAAAIAEGLARAGMEVTLRTVDQAAGLDYFDFDLVGVGAPSYNWHPPQPVVDFLRNHFAAHRRQGRVLPGAPRVVGHHALVFCTYSGPHTGEAEATPMLLYMGQFFDHIGFELVGQWAVLSEFVGNEEYSTRGRMGDIRGLPGAADLAELRERAAGLARQLAAPPPLDADETRY